MEMQELNLDSMMMIDGGANVETVGAGFGVTCATILAVCKIAGVAAVTASVTTVAAPVVLLGVAGAATGGYIMGVGLRK